MRLPRWLEIGIALAAALLAGCSTLRPMMGYRVDLPVSTDNCVHDLNELEKSGRELASAYSWRAAYNRNAIYAGGLLLLGTVAATAGLGAAGAAGLSIALLGVSGGFVSGAMLLFHNAELADAYTTAAASVNDALVEAQKPWTPTPTPTSGQAPKDLTEEEKCRARYVTVLRAITQAQNKLEDERTSIAASAAAINATNISALQTQVAALMTPTVPTETP